MTVCCTRETFPLFCASCLVIKISIHIEYRRLYSSHYVKLQCYLAKRPTGKPGVITTRVRVPDFSSRISASKTNYLMVFLQSPFAIACINTCAHVKNSKYWQLCTIVWTQKSCTLWWRDWVALLMRLLQPSPGKATRIFRKGLVK